MLSTDSSSHIEPRGGQLGGSPTAFLNRIRASAEANEPFDILSHCRQLGLDGAEAVLATPTSEAIRSIRQKVEDGMTVILNAPPPLTESDLPAFEERVRACKEAGAIALHTGMTQRRYEEFATLADFKTNFEACRRRVLMAEPVLRKHRIPLAIENHKGWRASEQARWMDRVSSEWIGVCLDMGNNIALCEMPDETFDLLTPYTVFCHMKDMAVQEYEDGLLLSEVPLGEGIIDIRKRVRQLRQKDPQMLFCLEMITRDPLQIPVLTTGYWRTFSDLETRIPAEDLAQVLALARRGSPLLRLPYVSHLSLAEIVNAEDEYNARCITFAREELGL